jgi:hypothetical protein
VSKKCEKVVLPLPYSGVAVSSNCSSLKQNSGLYTQCAEAACESGMCKGCASKAAKNGGVAPYGTIADRTAVGIMEFKDPKGRSPIAYSKLMIKLGLSEEAVVAEAQRQGVVVDAIHFLAPEMKRGRPKKEESEPKVKQAKGRPRKQKKVTEAANDADDLFMQLVEESNNEVVPPLEKVVPNTIPKGIEAAETKAAEKELAKAAEKLAKAAEKEQAKANEKAEKEQAKANEKAEKEQAKANEKAEKEQAKANEKAEKEQAKANEKAEKEQAKANEKAEKLAKAAEKEQQKLAKSAEKAEKEQQKLAKSAEKAEKEQQKLAKSAEKAEKLAKASEKEQPKVAEPAAEEEDVVKKFEHGGVKYLKSKKTGIVYNMEQDVIGMWNEQTQQIEFSEESDEESEEEYE